jgi:hypothetical protein
LVGRRHVVGREGADAVARELALVPGRELVDGQGEAGGKLGLELRVGRSEHPEQRLPGERWTEHSHGALAPAREHGLDAQQREATRVVAV